jgi:uncharacterized protein (DUF433 family)
VRFGKPCVNGTRISDFPQLKKEQILACLSFAVDKERKLKIAV